MQHSSLSNSLSWLHITQPEVWDYRDDLQNLACYLCDDPEGSSPSLLEAVNELDTFRGEASVRGWLHTVVTNECRMLRNRGPGEAIEEYPDHEVNGRTSSPEPRPQEPARELEIRREVLDRLAALPDNYRCAVLLKDGHGLTVEQTAGLMGASPAAIRSILYRARHSLRESFRA